MTQDTTTLVMLLTIMIGGVLSGCIEVGSVSSDQKTDDIVIRVQSPVTVSTPVYKTVYHKDPITETLYTITLIDASVWGDEVYQVTNVYDVKYVYSGDDAWGNSEYTVTVYYYLSIPCGRKMYSTYYEIDEHRKTSYCAVTGYNEWSEKVLV